MQYYNTCRFCKKASFERDAVMVRYSVRHWTHIDCGIAKWGSKEFFRKLIPAQLPLLPWKLIEEHSDAIRAAHPKASFVVESDKIVGFVAGGF